MAKVLAAARMPLIILLFIGHAWLFRNFFIDDAFITFRVLQQWTHGNGLVYNIGERVEAYSNFLWLVLLAPFDLIDLDLVLVAKIWGLVLGLLTLFVTYAFAKRLELPELPPFLLAASGPLAAWTMGGLETLLFTLLLTVSGYLFVREEEREKGWLSGPAFGLLALARPEGLLFAAVAGAFRLWRLFQARTKPTPQDITRLVTLMAIVIPYYLWRFSYYGYWLPNTVYAKSTGLHPRPVLEGIFYLYQNFVSIGGFFFLALPLALVLARANRPLFVNYLALNLAAYLFFVIAGGGDWMPMQRFLVHILPFTYLLVHAGLIQMRSNWSPRWASSIIVLLVLGQSGYLLATSLEQRFIAGVGSGLFRPDGGARVAYLQRQVHAGDTIAVIDAGIHAYMLPLGTRVVDMVGLANSHIAHQPAQFPNGLLGRGDAFGKWDVDYVLAQTPIFIQVHLEGKDEKGQWRTNFTGTTRLVNDPRFQKAYELVTEDGVHGVFVRKEKVRPVRSLGHE